MTNPILQVIVKLFAIFSNIDKDTPIEKVKPLVRFYVSRFIQTSKIDEYLSIFDFYNKQQEKTKKKDFFKEISIKSVKTLRLVDQINRNLEYSQKVYLLAYLIELLNVKKNILEDEYDFLDTLALSFNIEEEEFSRMKGFILNGAISMKDKESVLIISNSETIEKEQFKKFINRENLNGKIYFLKTKSANLFIFYYTGTEKLYLQEKEVIPNKIYSFEKGNAISSYKIGFQDIKFEPIFYTELAMSFLPENQKSVQFSVENIEFSYSKNQTAVKPFKFKTESFLLVGIIGSSGVGKSTLLNLLNGNLKPEKGTVKINGFDVYTEHEKLKGIIGYVPQEDLLFEELSVFENMYYNARLCFGNHTKKETIERVRYILEELDLLHIKDQKVGGISERNISGGERKRVNIALELIREPAVLLVDEPTSGLSSNDAIKIMSLLRQQSLNGKLVIVNIHQPHSKIFRLFDQLLVMDHGGHVIYAGDPMEALVYFKTIDNQVDTQQKECPVCGSINPEIILEIIEQKEVDERGKTSKTRKLLPDKWYKLYKENIESGRTYEEQEKNTLPDSLFRIPSYFKQFKIFFRRNFSTKIKNVQYVLISLVEAPLLAVILAYFSKYTIGNEKNPAYYIFSENVNMPSYLLMSIVVALFIGMLISAEEIFKDRKILIREKFLNLSRSSYLLSKIAYLFILSAIQIFTFVIIGNAILEIENMTFSYWIILFSTACFANMLGLNISSGLKSQIAIYILIPFLLIPQILLSGTIVKFDKLHANLTNELYPPIAAELMVSRWAFESLAVIQFKDNAYEKHFFRLEQKESELTYKTNIYIPELLSILDECQTELIRKKKNEEKISENLHLIINEIQKIKKENPVKVPVKIETLYHKTPTINDIKELRNYLFNVRKYYARYLEQLLYKKDEIIQFINTRKHKPEINLLKEKHYNHSLADLVKRKQNHVNLIEKNNQIIRKFEPVFHKPESRNGRAHFFAPVKRLGNLTVSTLLFNFIVIWIFNIILYITLYYNIIKKSLDFFRKN
jgi:ABC-type multidrug transport system ATPase subunit